MACGQDGEWAGQNLLVAVGGGIACYKSAGLVSMLVQAGADVRVVMTDAATRFVTPLTFQSLSGHPVITSIWEAQDHHDSQHIELASWADMLIISPATADLIAKLSAGLADGPVTLTALALARETPVLLAPAMNARMWQNPLTQRNIQTLIELMSYHTVGPMEGWQACRTEGLGRMAEPSEIMKAAKKLVLDTNT